MLTIDSAVEFFLFEEATNENQNFQIFPWTRAFSVPFACNCFELWLVYCTLCVCLRLVIRAIMLLSVFSSSSFWMLKPFSNRKMFVFCRLCNLPLPYKAILHQHHPSQYLPHPNQYCLHLTPHCLRYRGLRGQSKTAMPLLARVYFCQSRFCCDFRPVPTVFLLVPMEALILCVLKDRTRVVRVSANPHA